jgi:HEPN domain-containing protein
MKTLTKNWLDLAESDFNAGQYLYHGAHYPQAVYLSCQAIEKILKAVIIETSDKPVEYIHNLVSLIKQSNLKSTEKQIADLTELNRLYGRVRYRDLAQQDTNTKVKTEPIMQMSKEVYLWIKQQLKP